MLTVDGCVCLRQFSGSQPCSWMIETNVVRNVDPSTGKMVFNTKPFELGAIYFPVEQWDSVFEGEVLPLCNAVVSGKDVAIVTYGQRRTGKTSLINGFTPPEGSKKHTKTSGIFHKALEAMVNSSQSQGGMELKASYFSVEGNRVLDLFNLSKDVKLSVRGEKVVYPDSSVIDFGDNWGQLEEEKKKADGRVKQTSTVLKIWIRLPSTKSRFSCLTFVDMFGIERLPVTRTDSTKMMRIKVFNKQLEALMRVIDGLEERVKNPEAYIPFRESMLTTLLYDIGSAGGYVHFIVTCFVDKDHQLETTSSLSFAARLHKVHDSGSVALFAPRPSSRSARSTRSRESVSMGANRITKDDFGYRTPITPIQLTRRAPQPVHGNDAIDEIISVIESETRGTREHNTGVVNEMTQKDSEIRTLREQLVELTEQLEMAQNTGAELAIRNNILARDVRALEVENEGLREEIVRRDIEIQKQREEVDMYRENAVGLFGGGQSGMDECVDVGLSTTEQRDSIVDDLENNTTGNVEIVSGVIGNLEELREKVKNYDIILDRFLQRINIPNPDKSLNPPFEHLE